MRIAAVVCRALGRACQLDLRRMYVDVGLGWTRVSAGVCVCSLASTLPGMPGTHPPIFWLGGTSTRIFTHTHTHTFNGSFSRTTQVSRYQKGKTNLDFTEARDSEWQWHQLGHMQVCTSLQIDNHTSTPPLSFLQAGCPSCRPTNSVKALKETGISPNIITYFRT